MSKHWNPKDDLAEVRQARAPRREWPAGATAGIALVAAACLGVVVTLYWVAGPRDAFADDTAVVAGD
ncbi:MAG: hypothetical protein ACJ8D5_01600 [Sphingomicrobium sp.]